MPPPLPKSSAAAAVAGHAATGAGRHVDDDDDNDAQEVHHLIEKSEEGRLGKDHPKDISKRSSPSSPSLLGGNEGHRLLRTAFKVLLAGVVLFLLLTVVEWRGSTNTKDVNVGAPGPSAAEAAAMAAAAAKEKELQQQLAAETAKRAKAEAEAAAALQKLEEEKKAAAEEQKKKEEEAKVAAAAAEAAKAKEEEEEQKQKENEPATDAHATIIADDIVPSVDLAKLDKTKEQAKLAAAREAVAASLKTLQDEYGPEDAPLLFSSVHFLNREYIVSKLVRALLGQNGSPGKAKSEHDFVMSFAGTSVTAGHDNFYEQSYPVVLRKLLTKAFVAAGLNFEVRNHAMGNNPPIPASFCVKSQLGQDTDVAAWEFGMMISGDLQNAWVEEWMRNALHMPKRPALLMLDPGEGARKPAGDVLPTSPREGTPGDWSKAFGNLLPHYQAYGVHTQAMYEAVWTLDHTEKYNFKALVQDNKPTLRPAAWHPGPGGHLLRANILGHHYLTLLDEAVVKVQEAWEKDNVQDLVAPPLPTTQDNKDDDLPPPLYCDPMFCGPAASCAMTFEPKMQDSLLDKVISPAGLNKVAPTIESQDSKTWHTQLFEMDHEGVTMSQQQGFNYLDLKYVLQGNKDAGPLVLEVESQRKQHILLCQPPGVWNRMPDKCGDLRTDAEIQIDGVVMPFETSTVFYHQHALDSPTCWATKEEVEPGKHTVQLTPINADGKYITLSALIWF